MHKITTLQNGLRIVTEKITHVKSVAAGVWIGAGSYRETRANNGISHFIEHMLFKGTNKRTAKDIAQAIDDIGGQINAFTSRDCTCYYSKVLSNHLDLALDIISDMLFNSLYDPKDVLLEKNVIAEEISMYEDTPEELVHDLLMEKAWQKNPLGYSILGTSKSLKKISRDDIREYMNNYYTPKNAVIAVVGNFNERLLFDLINEKFGAWKDTGSTLKKPAAPRFYPVCSEVDKDIEQTHLCIGYNAIPRGHELDYALMLVNTVLGNGMSSRLFQKIREDKGLVYSIYSYLSMFANAGMFTIYAGMNPARTREVTELIFEEIEKLKKEGLSKEEIQKTKEQLKGSLVLSMEGTSSRMHSYGQSLLITNFVRSQDEMIERIDSLDAEKVNSAIELTFQSPAMALVQNSEKA
jgi:predicted Zn-dependent peptidase